jgi:enamine deaminase RidA (YjgF/YER057c/UK114 family)
VRDLVADYRSARAELASARSDLWDAHCDGDPYTIAHARAVADAARVACDQTRERMFAALDTQETP